jgi:excisionase family DNA binding protein
MAVALPAPVGNWLTTTEAAKRLGTTIAAVSKAVRDGRLEGVKFGRELAIRDRDVEAFRAKMGRTGRPAKGFRKP